MTDKEIWEKMLNNDLDTSILVEEIGLDKTIENYRNNTEDKELSLILSLKNNL